MENGQETNQTTSEETSSAASWMRHTGASLPTTSARRRCYTSATCVREDTNVVVVYGYAKANSVCVSCWFTDCLCFYHYVVAR